MPCYAAGHSSRATLLSPGRVANPRNLEALIGTSGSELIEQAGGYTGEAARLIMGGPMMGFTLHTDKVPIVKASNCLLAASTREAPDPGLATACIRCGKCAEVCPVSLLPQQMYWYARAKDLEKTQEYNLFDCIECGCCSHVCPAHIPLVQYFRFAKNECWDQEREKKSAELARMRHEAKLARLARLEAEKIARAQKKKAALARSASTNKGSDAAGDPKKAAIEAALKRAAEKKRDLPRRVSNHKTRIISPTPSAGRCNRRTPAEKPLVMATLDRPVNNRTADRCNSPPLPHHIRTDPTASLLPCYG